MLVVEKMNLLVLILSLVCCWWVGLDAKVYEFRPRLLCLLRHDEHGVIFQLFSGVDTVPK